MHRDKAPEQSVFFAFLLGSLTLFACGCDSGPPRNGLLSGVEICGNGADDDGNGRSDCLEPACAAVCPEDCLNGIDDNADWLVDCADDGCASTCDGDGDGYLALDVAGDDCNDEDPTINPGAIEVYRDKADNDCNADTNDLDQDGDGIPFPEDCNDVDALVQPGAEEVCGDGVFNDCSEDADSLTRWACFGARSLATADYHFDGSQAGGHAGWAVASADTDADDAFELYTGAPQVTVEVPAGGGVELLTVGAIYKLEGPFPREGGDLRTLGCELTGVTDQGMLGDEVVPVGPVDGSGLPTIGAGAPWEWDGPYSRTGGVYLLGQICGSGPAPGSALEIKGLKKYAYGSAFAALGDANGDGPPDLAIGSPNREDLQVEAAGVIDVLPGPFDRSFTAEDAFASIYGTNAFGHLGSAVAGAGDLDGDGLGELLIGAPDSSNTGPAAGAISIVNGYVPNGVTLDIDHLALELGVEGDQFGYAIAQEAGDFTGDGRSEVVASAPFADADFDDAGRVWIIDGLDPVSAAAQIEGAAAGDNLGWSLASLVDVDGDNVRDLAVGAPGHDGGTLNNPLNDSGAVYVWFGPLSGALSSSQADISLFGENNADFAGLAINAAGDVDLDGKDDLLVGAPYHSATFPGAGRIYLLTFGY